MEYYQSFKGIVLFRQEYREQDMLVKIFSREFGKQMFFVKNLQRANHPLASATLPFTQADFLGTIHQSGFSFLKETGQIHTNRKIHEDLEAQAVMSYLVQLVDAVMDDWIANPSLFDLLADSLTALENGLNPFILMHFFELKILKYFGVAFQWNQCLYCDVTQGAFDVSTKHQGILCARHLDEDFHRMHLNPRAVHVARQLVAVHSPLQIGELRLSQETLSDLKRLCDTVMDDFVGIRLKSKKFIEQMQEWQLTLQVRRNQNS